MGTDPSVQIVRFKPGRDETAWVTVWNAASIDDGECRRTTVEELTVEINSPHFNPKGRFLAMADQRPVGIIHAYIDTLRKEKKGVIISFKVIPELREQGIEKAFIAAALADLRNRGVTTVQTTENGDAQYLCSLWERLGFYVIRKFHLMERSLDAIPQRREDLPNLHIRKVRPDDEADLRLLLRIDNACFQDHFDFRPVTFEEFLYDLRENPSLGDQSSFLVSVSHTYAGFITIYIDPAYNAERHVKCGWVTGLGVLAAHRRQGLGTRLILHGMGQLKAKGMTTVKLDVDAANEMHALRLYETLGFRTVREYFVYERIIE